uniref:Polyprotein n=1 Tax=Cajanus cajan TaxID=3821 RepID=A0A151RT26_CAJCA|nr:polyprotein [Cajanus cajan]
MVQIFEPILHSALIYIDDILLFSPSEDSHKKLLQQFYQICNQYGVMLSSKKSEIGVKEVNFLGMHFAYGKYVHNLTL